MQLLGTVDADEVSPVKRGANRRRTILKEDGRMPSSDEQIQDILSIPYENEGALLDEVRKAGIDDEVIEKALLAGTRLLSGIAGELPPSVIEKLGSPMYSLANRPLNSDPGSGELSGDLFGGSSGMPDRGQASGASLSAQTDGPAMDGSGAGAGVNDGDDTATYPGRMGEDAALDKDDNSFMSEIDSENDDDDDDVAKAAYDEMCEKAERTFSPAQRRRMARGKVAMPDGSFPIPDADALRRAKMAVGRAKPGKRSAVRAHINRRAKALGMPGLGDSDVAKDSTLAAAFHTVAKALGMSQSARGGTPEDPDEGQEPGAAIPDPDLTSRWGSDDNVNKEDDEVIPVPIQKEDGSWDYSSVPEEARAYFRHTIEKVDRMETELASARERVAKQEAEATAQRIEKSARELSHAAPASEIAEVLKSASSTMTHDEYLRLESVLKTANARVAEGDLLSERGRTFGSEGQDSPGDAWSQILKAAEGVVEKSGGEAITKEQAIDRVLQTREGYQLYEQSMRDGSGMIVLDPWTGRAA